MFLTADYHTHTKFSHGRGTILENSLMAKQKGLQVIAITDHGFSHPAFGLTKKKVPVMRRLCSEAEQQTGVKVLLGIESNILGISGKTDLKSKDYDKFDVFLAGIHKFIFYDKLREWYLMLGREFFVKTFKLKPSNSLIKRNTEIYINTIKNNPIDILAHPGYGVHANLVEVAKCCRDYGTYFEIDTRKNYLSDEAWQEIADTGVEFVVDSDAHTPQNIGVITNASNIIERVGIPLDKIVNINGKLPKFMRFNDFKNR